jgi:elongation factor Ts
MAVVTPQMVKELREQTGAGMSDCKKALDAAEGDLDKAVTVLREKGLAAAAKKAGRAASEGTVSAVMSADNSKGYLVEVNCETDFVTRNEEFQALVANVQKLIAEKQPTSLEALWALPYPTGGTVQDTATGLVAKIGENIQVRRYATLGSGKNVVASYVHGTGKVGVLVELAAEGIAAHRNNATLLDLAKDIALQVAAMKPGFVSKDAIPESVIKAESEVFANQYRNQGKPENIIPKIVVSRVETWFKETCLVDQAFVKDDALTVSAYVAQVGKQLGLPGLKVASFERMELGQGVEKKTMDFASEVAAQIADASK